MSHLQRRSRVQVAVLAVPVLAVVAAGWHYRWMNEDGFIYLRIVRQIEAGHGPVFNAGERVEAFTGPLWLAYLVVADLLLPLRLEWVAVLSGLALTAAGVALMTAGSMRIWAPLAGSAWVLPVGSAVFVAVTPVWSYATSGLENGLVFAWIGACTLVLGRWADADRATIGTGGAVVLGLGWLVRPELVILSAVLLVAVVVADRGRSDWRARARVAAAALALPLAYQVFRMGYYGAVVANTGMAKEGGRLAVARGWEYLLDFTTPYVLVVPFVALVVGGLAPLLRVTWRDRDRRRTAAAVALAGGGLAVGASVVAVGGDYHHGRLMLSAYMAVLAPVAVVPVTRRHAVAGIAALWAIVAAVALRPHQYREGNEFAGGIVAFPPGLAVVLPDGPDAQRIREAVAAADITAEGDLGEYLPVGVPPDGARPTPMTALRGIGGQAYVLDLDTFVLDRLGLADPLGARLEVPAATVETVSGHEKPLPDPWVVGLLADRGAEIDDNPLPPWDVALWERVDGDEFAAQLASARAALTCPALADIEDAARAPLTIGRFVDNLFGAVGRTSVRVPVDPRDAESRFC